MQDQDGRGNGSAWGSHGVIPANNNLELCLELPPSGELSSCDSLCHWSGKEATQNYNSMQTCNRYPFLNVGTLAVSALNYLIIYLIRINFSQKLIGKTWSSELYRRTTDSFLHARLLWTNRDRYFFNYFGTLAILLWCAHSLGIAGPESPGSAVAYSPALSWKLFSSSFPNSTVYIRNRTFIIHLLCTPQKSQEFCISRSFIYLFV